MGDARAQGGARRVPVGPSSRSPTRGGGSRSRAVQARRGGYNGSEVDPQDRRDARRLGEPGTRIGPFVVGDLLGAGEMGIVVSAHDPDLDRSVAIKLLRSDRFPGDEPAARAGLLGSAQAMARLSHPNVITVHQVGVADGQVYVVMERLDGGTLRSWLRRERRGWREVRDVFERAGRGLAAAHAAGVVHRDFKPENVLVGGDGRLRVTDFGLVGVAASAAPAPPAADVEVTRTGTLAGTPLYMAPEQHDGKPGDARADQFAFCVALYEALFGRRPFAGDSVEALAAEVRAGRLREPGGDAPAWLRRAVCRGLCVAPEERHASMDALLEALGHDRVIARRRNVALAAVGVGAVAAAVWLVPRPGARLCEGAEASLAGVWDAPVRREVEARFVATGKPWAKASFDRAAARLDGYVRGWTGMHREACEATAAGRQSAQALDLRMSCLHRRLLETQARVRLLATADPEIVARSAELVDALGDVAACADVQRLAAPVPPPADPAARAAVDRFRGVLASSRAQASAGRYREAALIAAPALAGARALGYRPLEAEAGYALGRALTANAQPREADAQLTQAVLAADAGHHDEVRLDSEIQLVEAKKGLGRYDDALRTAEAAEAGLERWGKDPLRRAELGTNVAMVLLEQGKLADARARIEQSLPLREEAAGPDALVVATSLLALANIDTLQSRLPEAEAHYERAAAIVDKAAGPAHPTLGVITVNLAVVAVRRADYARAQTLYERGLRILEDALGADNRMVVKTLGLLGHLLEDYPAARATLQRALALFDRPGANEVQLAEMLGQLAWIDFEQRRLDAALASYERALALQERALGPEHAYVGGTLRQIGMVLTEQGKLDAATERLERARAIFVKSLGPEHLDVGKALAAIGALRTHQGRLADARDADREAIAILAKNLGDDHLYVAEVRNGLANVLLRMGRAREALAEAERTSAAMEKAPSPGAVLPQALTIAGRASIALGQAADAIAPLERALALEQAATGAAALAGTRFALARALWDANRDRARARALAREARQADADVGAAGQADLAEVDAWLTKHR